ncbi:MAG: DUF2231 domain-containing protein [Opitutales bacterium]
MPSLIAAAGTEELVTLWRIELLHPATIHFSIALTMVGGLFWLAGALRGRWPQLWAFDTVACVTICLAAIATWAAVQTGFWADEVVGRELYDPRPLKDHENAGLTLAWVMTGAAAVDLLRRLPSLSKRLRAAGWLLVAGLLLVASGLVIHTAHLGAGLVYQQGAGVRAPSQE